MANKIALNVILAAAADQTAQSSTLHKGRHHMAHIAGMLRIQTTLCQRL